MTTTATSSSYLSLVSTAMTSTISSCSSSSSLSSSSSSTHGIKRIRDNDMDAIKDQCTSSSSSSLATSDLFSSTIASSSSTSSSSSSSSTSSSTSSSPSSSSSASVTFSGTMLSSTRSRQELSRWRKTILPSPENKCWIRVVDLLPTELRLSKSDFNRLWALHPPEFPTVIIFDKSIPTPRWFQNFGRSYHFSKETHIALPLRDPFLQHLRAFVWLATGLPFDQIGWHADSESQLVQPNDLEVEKDIKSTGIPLDEYATSIFSFSFGATRRFDIRPKSTFGTSSSSSHSVGVKKTKTESGSILTRTNKHSDVQIYLCNNSCVVMGGETQRYFKHQVPTEKKVKSRRINVTFRLFKDTYLLFRQHRLRQKQQLLTCASSSSPSSSSSGLSSVDSTSTTDYDHIIREFLTLLHTNSRFIS